MYNKLMGCRTVEQIQAAKDTCFPQMACKDIDYLNKLANTSQYPAAAGQCVHVPPTSVGWCGVNECSEFHRPPENIR